MAERDIDPSAEQSTAIAAARESRLERVSRRAYEIYQARGGEHLQDMDDWLRAEREIDSEFEGEQTS